MRKIWLGSLVLLGLAPAAQAGFIAYPPVYFALEGQSTVTVCQIREVRLLAEDRERCERAGGRVTHRVVHKLTDVRDSE